MLQFGQVVIHIFLLNNIFSTNYVPLQRFPLDEAKKKHQTMENLEM